MCNNKKKKVANTERLVRNTGHRAREEKKFKTHCPCSQLDKILCCFWNCFSK